MTMREIQSSKNEDKEFGIKKLFPDGDADRNQLTMVTRTPPHMIIQSVVTRMMEETLDYVTRLEAEIKLGMIEASEGDDTRIKKIKAQQGLLDPSEVDIDELKEEYEKVIRGEGKTLNLLKIAREEFDLRMISRNGEGRAEMIDILSTQARANSKDDDSGSDVIWE